VMGALPIQAEDRPLLDMVGFALSRSVHLPELLSLFLFVSHLFSHLDRPCLASSLSLYQHTLPPPIIPF